MEKKLDRYYKNKIICLCRVCTSQGKSGKSSDLKNNSKVRELSGNVENPLKCRQRMCEGAYRASSNGSERNI